MFRDLASKFKSLFKRNTPEAPRQAPATDYARAPAVDTFARRERFQRALAAFKSLSRRCANRVGIGQVHRPEGKRDAHPPGYFWKRDIGARDGVGTPRWRLYRTLPKQWV